MNAHKKKKYFKTTYMKTRTAIIVNEGNLDFLFNILNSGGYQVGFGESPGYDNTHMKEVVKDSVKDAAKTLAICYIEIDSKRKRYVPLTKWVFDNKEFRDFIQENIHSF